MQRLSPSGRSEEGEDGRTPPGLPLKGDRETPDQISRISCRNSSTSSKLR